MRDVCAIVTERGAGCDGPPRRQALLHQTKTLAADGEVVWSWRRDPGATPAGVFRPATGARKAASPGRAHISRKTIARGKPGCLGCTCQIRVRSSLPIAHGAAGAVGARLSLRPLCFGGASRCKAQAESRRENEDACLSVIASEAKQSSLLCRNKKAGLLRRCRSSQ